MHAAADDITQGGALADIGQLFSMVFTSMPGAGGDGRPGKRKAPACAAGDEAAKKHKQPEPIDNPRAQDYDVDETQFYATLTDEEKGAVAAAERRALDACNGSTPLRFQILLSDMDDHTKSVALRKLDALYDLEPGYGEYHKTKMWLDSLCKLPLGKYAALPVTPDSSLQDKRAFLMNTRSRLDGCVYGHAQAKDSILRLLAQWTMKPDAKGMVLGLVGFPGTGKTSLLREGVSAALNLPFAAINLGGATDGAFLEGFAATYEGSCHGRIASCLMQARCMNPVLYFDECDKVSGTHRGEEIANLLIHLTDPSQNRSFSDRYFGEVPLDLSRCLIVFSFNDPHLVSPILLDRMHTIHVDGYSTDDKLKIAKQHLLPDVLREHALQPSDVCMSDGVLRYIISAIECEQGVRNLKRALRTIVGDLNMRQIMDSSELALPVTLTEDDVRASLASMKQRAERHTSAMYI
jgi:ATP-dependent Lon protease